MQKRIPFSSFLNIEDIVDKNSEYPNQLPDLDNFNRYMKNYDICYNDDLVLYDDYGMTGALRAFTTFNAFGKSNNLQVLDGGLNNYKGELEHNEVKYTNKSRNLVEFPFKKGIINYNDINIAAKNINLKKNDYCIIDTRSPERFSSVEEEPTFVKNRGNIQNSINIFYAQFFNKDQTFKSKEEIKSILEKYNIDYSNPNLKIISTCGSGVTACTLLFALKLIGKNNNYLYNGSWAEYGSKEAIDLNKVRDFIINKETIQ